MFAQGRERAALPLAEAGGIRRPREDLMNGGTWLHIGSLREGLARGVNPDRKGPLPHRLGTGAPPSL